MPCSSPLSFDIACPVCSLAETQPMQRPFVGEFAGWPRLKEAATTLTLCLGPTLPVSIGWLGRGVVDCGEGIIVVGVEV